MTLDYWFKSYIAFITFITFVYVLLFDETELLVTLMSLVSKNPHLKQNIFLIQFNEIIDCSMKKIILVGLQFLDKSKKVYRDLLRTICNPTT